MKLKFKLPLAFAFSLGLLFFAGLYGIFSLSNTVNDYRILHQVDDYKKANEVAAHFTLAIQEWKNVLLRGKNPSDAEKYWSAHTHEMATVYKLIDELEKMLGSNPAYKKSVADLKTAMMTAEKTYEKGLAAYKSSGNDHIAGDIAVKGADREPAAKLTELSSMLSKADAESTKRFEQQADNATQIALSVMIAVALISLIFSILMARKIVGEIRRAAVIADKVALGDLTSDILISGKDEVADLLNALRSMQSNLTRLVSCVRVGSEQVATASSEIARGNADLSVRTEQQSSALQETTSSMQQISSVVSQSAENAQKARQLATEASEITSAGGGLMSQVVDTMKGISESSHKIEEIIGVIDTIAFHTNILALNAAVEAARAGDQGRGFAVVASEVRALAHRSATAAKEIKALISASVERISYGSGLVDQAGSTMTNVVAAINKVSSIMSEINEAGAQQDDGVRQIGLAVEGIGQATQQNAALVEEIATSAESLKNQAMQLVRSTEVFKVAGPEAVAA